MFVWATRTLANLLQRAALLAGLFILVIVLQVALITGLQAWGWSPPQALGASGVGVLGIVLGVHFALRRRALRRRTELEQARIELGLPDGPCCVIWRPGPGEAFPWRAEGRIKARYPPIAQRLAVEGLAVVSFEIGHDGIPKNLHCVDVWPSMVFYDAAAQALRAARFTSTDPAGPRFGPSYEAPFVFRIQGASRLRASGRGVDPRALAGLVKAWLRATAGRLTKRQSS